MAQSSKCYLPRFATAVDGPKRPVSMKTRPTPSQNAQLLTAWHEGRLNSVLQATWGLVLHYYLRTEDICFGYQHIDGDATCSRSPAQRASITNISPVRLAIQENDSTQQIVDKVWKNLKNGGSVEAASDGHLPFNTILMLRTYKKSDSASSKPMLATALPDQVCCAITPCMFLINMCAYPSLVPSPSPREGVAPGHQHLSRVAQRRHVRRANEECCTHLLASARQSPFN